jgi:type I restriction enzyme S subunit
MEATATKATFQKYSAYKDSGVEWLAEIPEHWQAIKMKYLFRDVSEKNKPEAELLSVTQDKGVVPRTWVESRMVMPSGNLESFKFIQKGDFAISLRSFEGGLEYCHHDGIISPAYTVLKKKKGLIDGYYKYLFKSKSFISEIQTSVVGIREGKNISYFELSYSLLPIPSPEEQTAIAKFLDDKTAKIDRAIAQKEKMIALLKERKQIIIQNAVTKGLDPNAKMKDSGVEWIGEIPEGWEVKRLRNVFSFSKGLTITKENLQDEGIPCINYGEIHSKYGFEVNPEVHPLKCVSEEYLKDNSNSLLKRGDFIFADTSEDLEGSGNFTHLNFEGTVFAGYHTIIGRPKSSINSRFLAYVLHSLPFRNQVRTRMKGVKVFSITQSILKDLTCWYPDEKEQKTIAKYLDIEAAKIDKAIKLQEQQIEKLKELKSTLIDSAVTGKLRVPSVQEIKVS